MSSQARTVVVGIDGADGGDAALAWGTELAARRRAPMRLVRVVDPSLDDQSAGAAVSHLDRALGAVRAAHPGLDVTSALVADDPAARLLEESRAADTVVLGSRGAGGSDEIVAGSTAMHVSTHAGCTVVTVPPGYRPGGSRHGIVVGVDGSAVSMVAIGFAFREASETGQPLVAVHAGDAAIEVPDRELAESLAGWSEQYPDVAVERSTVHDLPVRALTDAARGATLLVVGCRGSGAVQSLLLGSVSHGVLHRATCPVAVVRSG